MPIQGKRVTRNRLIRTSRFIVEVQVEAVVPDSDRSEACFEPATVEWLREVERRANSGELQWLLKHGKVYVAVETTGEFSPPAPIPRSTIS